MTAWYGIIDTAQDARLYDAVVATPDHVCLFSGRVDPAVAKAAPYLVNLDTAPDFSSLWRGRGWAGNWGVVCRSDRSFEELRRHFRKFLLSALPDGSAALFRFYDPRVFRTYLPTVEGDELQAWFDGIDEYVVAAADGIASHRLIVQQGAVQAQPPLPAR